jgi:glycerophosphoryl diester phosphodiesterase
MLPDMPSVIIAHRTCPRHAAENSLKGIRTAADLGADAVEIDVQRTLDGVPILMHDRTLWRTAGLYCPTRLLPYALIRRLRLKRSSERVPTLAEALVALPDGLTVAIDVKHASAAATTLADVRRHRLEDRTLLWSKHASAVHYTAGAAPEIESSLLRDVRRAAALRRFLDDAVRLGARGISAHWQAITEGFVSEAHRCGLKVYSMSRDVESMAAKLALGLDGIVTDWPEAARAALQSRERAH